MKFQSILTALPVNVIFKPFVPGTPTDISNNGIIEIISESSTKLVNITIENGKLVNQSSGTVSILKGSSTQNSTISAPIDNKGTFNINSPLYLTRTSATHLNSGTMEMNELLNLAAGNELKVSNRINFGDGYIDGDGKFTLEDGATIQIKSLDGITATDKRGNVQCTNRSFSQKANYIYKGTSTQFTGNGIPAVVENITIDNSSGVSASRSFSVSKQLALANGKFQTDVNTIIDLGSDGIISGEQTDRFVEGNLRASRFVGKGNSTFGGIGVTFFDGADDIGTITITRTTGANAIVKYGTYESIRRKWNISTSIQPASGRNIRLTWLVNDNNGRDLSKAYLWKSDDSGLNWNVFGDQFNAVSGSAEFNTKSLSIWTVADYQIPTTVTEYIITKYISPSDAEKDGCTLIVEPNQQKYSKGTTVKATASHQGKWKFKNWSGDLNGTETSKTFSVDKNMTITALFEVITVPNKPTNLSATKKSNSQIELKWSDNSTDETGFKVERKIGIESWSLIASLPVNTTLYLDNDVTISRTYSYRVTAENLGGSSEYSNEATITLTDLYNHELLPNSFYLFQNFPNPFNPTTEIRYQISEFSKVSLKVYDVLGREVETLVDEYKSSGIYNSQFSINHSPLPSGVYFYTLRAGNFVSTKKLLLLK